VFKAARIQVLKIKLLVLLLQEADVSLDLFSLLVSKLFLHLTECLLLCLLCHMPFELFLAYAIFEHVDLVLVVVLDGLNHGALLGDLLVFLLPVVLFLLYQLVFLEVRGELEHLLAEACLLGITLNDLRPLLADHAFFELLLSHLLDLVLPEGNLLSSAQVLLPLCLLELQVHPVLLQQALKLLLLLENPLIGLDALFASRAGCRRTSKFASTRS